MRWDASHVDLLDALFSQEGDAARASLRQLIMGEGPEVREARWNCFEVEVDMAACEARVWDVLDGRRGSDIFTLSEFSDRLC